MWVFLNNAFVSIVENPKNPATLLVRARRKRDLVAFFQCDPKQLEDHIYHDINRDYHYRVTARREYVGKMVAKHATNIDYGNFKDSIKSDDDLHQMATEVWVSGFRNLDERAMEYYASMAASLKKTKPKLGSGKVNTRKEKTS